MIVLRSAMLQAAFRLLYGPLVFLHEPLGRFLWGKAWAARRLYLMNYLQPDDHILDVGCGEGHLLLELNRRYFDAAGVEPSRLMRRICTNKSLNVRPGSAQHIPWPDRSFNVIVATYPGNWIFDSLTWSEFRRVTASGSRVLILLGGDYRCGPLFRIRSVMIRLIYPRSNSLYSSHSITTIEDQWGSCQLLVCELD